MILDNGVVLSQVMLDLGNGVMRCLVLWRAVAIVLDCLSSEVKK